MQTSLVPVREALKKLEGEGFVQIIPRRGAFVTNISIYDMEDLHFARGMLERQVGYHAAPNLTANDIERLDDLHYKIYKLLERHDYGEFTHLNRSFHFVIYDAAKSKYLSSMIASLWDLAERYRYC
ncbi:MAG: GntR family transcriptional regulator, partial [Anaerolineae bacterium]